MKPQKIKNYCHEPDCTGWILLEWNGEFIPRYYCAKHAFRYLDQNKGNHDPFTAKRRAKIIKRHEGEQ